MSSGTSHLEESGVWCADDESGDDVFTSRTTQPTSPILLNGRSKHSGGSIDASCDVQIVDLKDFENGHKFRPGSSSSKKFFRHHSRRRSFGKYGADNDKDRMISQKRRSSSFSKVFSYNRQTAPPVVMRRTSFGIKRIPSKSRTVEINDEDLIWPAGIFQSKATNNNKRTSTENKPNYARNTSTTTSDFTMKSESTVLMDPRTARSEQTSLAGNTTFSRSITSRPSVASSLLREPPFYMNSAQRTSHDTSAYYMEDGPQIAYSTAENTLQSVHDGKSNPNDIEEMVENINMRNFLSKDNTRPEKVGLHLLVKQLTCLYFTTALFVIISLLLLGLTIWLINDSNALRHSVNDITNILSQNNGVKVQQTDIAPVASTASSNASLIIEY